MLFAIVSTCACWAFMPEAAVIMARIMRLLVRGEGGCGSRSVRLVEAAVGLFDRAHRGRGALEAALHGDQRDELVHRLDVRALDAALAHARRGLGRLRSGRC